MANFNTDLDTLTSQLQSTSLPKASGVSFVGRKLKLDNANDAKIIVDEINKADKVEFLNMEGNSLGVDAAKEISKALKDRKEFKEALWKDMFTSRLKNEIPIALKHLTGSLMLAGARLQVLDLSDNASGPIGVEGFEEFLRSPSCYSLRELRLNNMGLGITGATKLASALLDLYNNSKNAGEPLKLEVFIAGRNRLENDGATALAQVFQKIGTLKEISIPQNGIYHAGITALSAAFNENLSLQVINLNDNTCTVKGARALSQVLDKLSNLKVLDCGDCLLRSKGALAIAESIRNLNNLETLNLSFNEIKTDAGSRVLNLLTPLASNLTVLNMDGNMFGPKMCNELTSVAEQLSLPLCSLEEDEGGDGDDYDEEQSDVDEEDDENDEDDEDDDDEDGGEEEEEDELDDTESDQPYNIDGGKKIVKKRKIPKTPSSPAALPEINLVTSLLENFSMTSPKTVSNPSECQAVIEISDSNNPADELKEDRSESASNSVGDVAEDSGCCEADNLLSEISPHSPTDIVESVQNEGKMSLDDSCLNSPQNEMDIDDSEKNQKENNVSTEPQPCTEPQEMEIEPNKISINSERCSDLVLPNSELSLPENSLDENEDIIMTHTSSPLQEKINTIKANDQKEFILPTDQEIPAIEKVVLNKTEDIYNERDNSAMNDELVINVEDKCTSAIVSIEPCLMESNDKVEAVDNDKIIVHSNVNNLEAKSVNIISKDVPSADNDTLNVKNTIFPISENVKIDREITFKEAAISSTSEGTMFNPDTKADQQSDQEIKSFEVIIGKESNQETLISSLDNEISNNVENVNLAVEIPNDDMEAIVEVRCDESLIVTSTLENIHNENNINSMNHEPVINVEDKPAPIPVSIADYFVNNDEGESKKILFLPNVEVSVNIISKDALADTNVNKQESVDNINTNVDLGENSNFIPTVEETKRYEEMTCKGDSKEKVISSISEGALFYPNNKTVVQECNLENKSFENIISKEAIPETLVNTLEENISNLVEDIKPVTKYLFNNEIYIESVVQVECDESHKVIVAVEKKIEDSDSVVELIDKLEIVSLNNKDNSEKNDLDFISTEKCIHMSAEQEIPNEINIKVEKMEADTIVYEGKVETTSYQEPIKYENTEVDVIIKDSNTSTLVESIASPDQEQIEDDSTEIAATVLEVIASSDQEPIEDDSTEIAATAVEAVSTSDQEPVVDGSTKIAATLAGAIASPDQEPIEDDGTKIAASVVEASASSDLEPNEDDITNIAATVAGAIASLDQEPIEYDITRIAATVVEAIASSDQEPIEDDNSTEIAATLAGAIASPDQEPIEDNSTKISATVAGAIASPNQEPNEDDITKIAATVAGAIASPDQELIEDDITKIAATVVEAIASSDQEPIEGDSTEIAATAVESVSTSDQEPVEDNDTKIAATVVGAIASSDQETTNDDEAKEAVTVQETVTTFDKKPTEDDNTGAVLEVETVITSDQEPVKNDSTKVEVTVVDSVTTVLELTMNVAIEEASGVVETATASDQYLTKDDKAKIEVHIVDNDALCDPNLNKNDSSKVTETVVETIALSSQESSKDDNTQVEVNMVDTDAVTVVELIKKDDTKIVTSENTVATFEKEPTNVDDTKVEVNVIDTDTTSVVELTKNVGELTKDDTKVDVKVVDSVPQSVQVIPSAVDTKENIADVISTPNHEVTKNMDNKLEDKSDAVTSVNQESSLVESDVKPEIIPPYSQEISQVIEIKAEMVKPDLISGCEEKLLNINNSLVENIAKPESPSDLGQKTTVEMNVEPNLITVEKPKADVPVKIEGSYDVAVQVTSNQGDESKTEKEPEFVSAKPHGDVKQTLINQPTNDKVEKVKTLSHSTKSGKGSPDSKKNKSKCVVM